MARTRQGDRPHRPRQLLLGEDLGEADGRPARDARQELSWHSTGSADDRAPQATFESDATDDPPDPGEYTAALTLSYAVDDGTGVSHLESLVIENVKFTVSE